VVFINEWFPNPPGVDDPGEFIELYNSASTPVALDGWTLRTEKGKIFSLNGRVIAARGYLVLRHADTKLVLRNSDGGLALYNAAGALADHGSFSGAAPVGESFSRVDHGVADIAHFAFADPTPGGANNTPNLAVMARTYPMNVPLYAGVHLNGAAFFGIMMGTAALVAGLITYIARAHEDLSHILFGGNNETRGTSRAGDFSDEAAAYGGEGR
jgi:Lamin Tail Domain